MRYAKLINNFPTYATNPILHAGLWYGNPPGYVYEAEGYKPVRYTEPPEAEEGYIAVPVWVETAEEIVKMWTEEPEPITDEDALVRYANEITGADDPDIITAAETMITKLSKED